jgi:predicted metalloprotease with PDZ domain
MRYFIILTFSFFCFLQSVAGQTLHYRIKPVPLSDRTNLEISLNYQTAKTEPLNVKLPVDCYGTPRLYRFVTSFTGESETVVKNGKNDGERIVQPNRRGEIRLKYVLSFDPGALADFTYSPNVGNGYFHVGGCQWMLQIGGAEEKHPHVIELVGAPKGWQLYSSLGANPSKFEGVVSYEDLVVTAIGGGRQGFSRFFLRGKPVSVFVRGKYTIPQTEILAAVRKIVRLQRERFNDFTQPFYNVVVLPKEDSVAGVRIENMFVSFFKSDVTREQLYVLMSHEMLHNWLTADIIKPPKGETGLKYQWFYEGFSDYFARRILFDARLLTPEKFAGLVNRDIVNIADNPHKNATFQDLIRAAETGKFNQPFNKLSYYRGALIALKWDARIRRNNLDKSLGNLIEDVYRRARQSDGSIGEEAFFELVERNYGIDAKADFERYILRGEPISIDSDALGSSYNLRETAVPAFDEGFLLNESRQTKKISGVKAGGPAYRAGLRDGMEFVGVENYNRFANAWNPSAPLVVLVKEQNKKRRISFYPHGAPHKLLLFQAVGKKSSVPILRRSKPLRLGYDSGK